MAIDSTSGFLGGVVVFLVIVEHLALPPLDAAAALHSERQAPNPIPDTTTYGVVWTPPPSVEAAVRALTRIDEFGANAIRLTRLPADSVVAYADSLELQLYVPAPVGTGGSTRANTRSDGSSPFDRILSFARRYSAVAYVGLGKAPNRCDMLRRWTDRLHGRRPQIRTYYVTPLPPSANRCADVVDRVLLDLRGVSSPVDRWRAWRSKTNSVGIGALGTWRDPEAPSGLRVPHSPESQARYLEDALSGLLDSTRTTPPAVFVHRWQDTPSALLSSRRYGLHEANGARRPAARVVNGLYSGTQTVFAFPSGTPSNASPSLVVIFAWGLIAAIGAIYAQSLFVRRTVARYFSAHGFYTDAVRQGRELHPGLTAILLCIVAASLGGAGARIAEFAGSLALTDHAIDALSPEIGSVLARAVEQPAFTGFVVGGIALVLVLLWTGILLTVARRWSRFTLSQGLALTIWPTWPGLLPLPLALGTGPDTPLSPSLFGVSLLGGSTVALVYYTLAVLGDYQSVTDVPWPVVVLLAGLSPLFLLGLSLAALDLQYDIPFVFFWRLATHT